MNDAIQVKVDAAPNPAIRFPKRKPVPRGRNRAWRSAANNAAKSQPQTKESNHLISVILRIHTVPTFGIGRDTQLAPKNELLAIHSDLIALRSEEDEEDYIYKPTDYAFNTAVELLRVAYLGAGGDISRPAVTPDGEGGIRIEWRHLEREVRLICPAQSNQQPYIYFEVGDNFKIVEDVNGNALASWLSWLNNA